MVKNLSLSLSLSLSDEITVCACAIPVCLSLIPEYRGRSSNYFCSIPTIPRILFYLLLLLF